MRRLATLLMLVMLFASAAYAETQTLTIDGHHGKLSAEIQKPALKDGEQCQLVMLLHGFTGDMYNRPLTDIADALEARGIASIRFDFNGHGKSEGKFINMTVLNEIEDARQVFAYVKDLRWVSSVSIAGHSQGGVVTSMLAGELGDDVKSVVLLAPAAVLRDDALRGLTMGTTYDAGNPPESVSIFGRFELGREYILTAQTLPIYETAEKYTGPVCLIHGTADRIVPYTYSLSYHKVYKNSTLNLIDGADHGFTNYWDKAAELAVDFLAKQ